MAPLGRPRPETLEAFLALPSLVEWEGELLEGWPGPNGSSNSPDDLQGVRIGSTSQDYADAMLPANLHDYRYRLARRWALPYAWREPADAEYRDGCVARVEAVLIGWRVKWAKAKAWGRYAALRLAGWTAWR